MAREKLKILFKALDKEIKNASSITKKSLQSAMEISRGTAASPSTSGDREHAVNQARLNEENLAKLINFRKQLQPSLGKPTPKRVQPISFVSLNYKSSSGPKQFYFVATTIYLREFLLISPDSPLGKAIKNKEVGQNFEYVTQTNKPVKGQILKIE